MNRRAFFKGLAAAIAVASVVPKKLVEFVSDFEPIPGWIPCDGRVLNRYKYPDLFATIGELYSDPSDAIEGSFCVPDFRSHGDFVISTSKDTSQWPIGVVMQVPRVVRPAQTA